jgi:hypothetical protein
MPHEQTPDFTQLPAGAVAFPEASEVFVADQQELARHLHPLLSVDASSINPQWSGHLHLLSPLEPDEGLVGELTEDWFLHSDLVKTNWIGFKLEDGRYRLCGDPRYFFLHPDNTQLHEAEPRQVKKLQAHYAEQQASFEATRQHYREHGHLVRTDWEDGRPLEFIESLGGDLDGRANWVETVEFPMHIIEADDDSGDSQVWPLSPAGRRFQHVLSVPGWHYRSAGADAIVMLYEPEEGLVLLTFDWS